MLLCILEYCNSNICFCIVFDTKYQHQKWMTSVLPPICLSYTHTHPLMHAFIHPLVKL